jgi:hypothetical protein
MENAIANNCRIKPTRIGQTRALMFLALDKIWNQGLKKVMVAVAERSLAGSLAKADLKKENKMVSNKLLQCSKNIKLLISLLLNLARLADYDEFVCSIFWKEPSGGSPPYCIAALIIGPNYPFCCFHRFP